MKRCNYCNSSVLEISLFCPTCGRSFGRKLCRPHLHANPPTASFCAICGSRDLSSPHPLKTPTLTHYIAISLLMLSSVLLAFVLFYSTLSGTSRLWLWAVEILHLPLWVDIRVFIADLLWSIFPSVSHSFHHAVGHGMGLVLGLANPIGFHEIRATRPTRWAWSWACLFAPLRKSRILR